VYREKLRVSVAKGRLQHCSSLPFVIYTYREIAKELNITPVVDKIQNYQKQDAACKWNGHVTDNWKSYKRVDTKRQEETGKTFEASSGCVRPERVNKWLNCVLAT